MATIKEVINMCKGGKLREAYDVAKKDLDANRANLWTQREMSWVLFYRIKDAVTKSDFTRLTSSLNELKTLDLLSVNEDSVVFENVLFKIVEYVKNQEKAKAESILSELSVIFSLLSGYKFGPSAGYSALLRCCISFSEWNEILSFLDWWSFDNLSDDDYKPFVNDKGFKMLSLAERAYIAKSKALIKQKDTSLIRAFLPQLETLMQTHVEMLYPGYFYGKLLMTLGDDKDEILRVLIPFVRKKSGEFWAWDLLSEVYQDEPELYLACLLRAVHCKAKEGFLGKVRTKLASLYIKQGQYDRARYQIDVICDNYASQGWRLSGKVFEWSRESWINNVEPNSEDSIAYRGLTDALLYTDKAETVAVVTYLDVKSNKMAMVYGYEKRVFQRLGIRYEVGTVLKIVYSLKDKRMIIIDSQECMYLGDVEYIKELEGVVARKICNAFAFIKAETIHCYVAPQIVQSYNIQNGQKIRFLAVYDYNKQKNEWGWVCVKVCKLLNDNR